MILVTLILSSVMVRYEQVRISVSKENRVALLTPVSEIGLTYALGADSIVLLMGSTATDRDCTTDNSSWWKALSRFLVWNLVTATTVGPAPLEPLAMVDQGTGSGYS